jgi:polyamine:H+ symporter
MQHSDTLNDAASPTTTTSAICTSTLLVPRFLPHRYCANGVTHGSGGSLVNSNGSTTPDGTQSPNQQSAVISPTPTSGGSPRQLLTTITLLGVLYANCIGSGYGFEDSVGSAGPLVTLLFAFFVPWIWCLPTGLAVAELATAVRSNSGVLMWVNVAFHPAVSFLCVIITVFITFVGNASYPTLAAEYIDRLIPIGVFGKALVKLVCIFVCAALNVSGVEIVGNASVIISFATLAPFLLFTIQHLLFNFKSFDVSALLFVPPNIDWATFLAITSWSFANIENAGTIVEEVKNPKKTLAGAMIPLMLLTYPAYFLPVAAGVSAMGHQQDYSLWKSGYWATVAEHISGPIAKWMMLAGSITTSFGFTLTTLCCTSRNLEGMGVMDIFPAAVNRFLTKSHPKYQTPYVAILLNATVTSMFCIALEFESIVALCQVLYCVRLLLIYAAVLQLRIRHPTLPRPYALPCGIFGCLLALTPPAIFSLVVAVACAYHDSFVKGAVAVFLVGGLAFSCVYVSFHRPRGFRGQIVAVMRRRSASDAETTDNDETTLIITPSTSAPPGSMETLMGGIFSIPSESIGASPSNPAAIVLPSITVVGSTDGESQTSGSVGDELRLRRR